MGYLLAKSLQAAGVDAKAISFHPHSFDYKESAEICTEESYADYVSQTNVIVAMHSVYKPCDLNGKKLFVFHGGSIYRKYTISINNFFNNLVKPYIDIMKGMVSTIQKKQKINSFPTESKE